MFLGFFKVIFIVLHLRKEVLFVFLQMKISFMFKTLEVASLLCMLLKQWKDDVVRVGVSILGTEEGLQEELGPVQGYLSKV